MATTDLSRRVEKVVGYPPLSCDIAYPRSPTASRSSWTSMCLPIAHLLGCLDAACRQPGFSASRPV